MNPSLLLKRLNEIGRSLEQSGHALALIGLGSVGLELDRLDEFSDLDFFVIVEEGHKHAYLADLHWLSDVCPIAYRFLNTKDGYKVLFEDGIFCECAVFEPEELSSIPFAPGRVVWKQPHVSEAIARPIYTAQAKDKHTQEWLLGEALTNLLIGLSRDRRGEKLSAMRFIQGYAVDRILELADEMEISQGTRKDDFGNERRFEQRYPTITRQLAACLQGYERNRESALAILALLEQHFAINEAMAAAIRALCQE